MAKRYRSSASQWKVLKPWPREMRKAPTEAEAVQWRAIRGGAVHGLKFRRQHAVGRRIMDFFAAKPRVAIEVDGPIHDAHKMDDAERDRFLHSQGIRVLRVRNEDVLIRLPWVIERIKAMCGSPASSLGDSPSSQRGEGPGSGNFPSSQRGEGPGSGNSPSPQGGERAGAEVFP